jgi:APA family basic amino acid/polyamine antiporter
LSGLSAAAVSAVWGHYLNELLFDLFGIRIPGATNAAPGEGGFFNLPAVMLVTPCGLLLICGAQESAGAGSRHTPRRGRALPGCSARRSRL